MTFRYLDHAAATPIEPEVVALVGEVMSTSVGNPTGSHAAARHARRLIEDARDELAIVVGCRPHEIVFCSGGTEADALAVRGLGRRSTDVYRVLCGATEHPAVLDHVFDEGGATIAVSSDGQINLEVLRESCSESDAGLRLVSVMAVNHEVGTVQPIVQVAEVVRSVSPDTVIHSDATQALRWMELSEIWEAVDSLSLSGHKFGGPEGVGALVVRDGVALRPVQLGGGQERERRSGSHDVAGIVGMARAATLASERRAELVKRCRPLRDHLEAQLTDCVDAATIVGSTAKRVSGVSMCGFEGVESEALLFMLDAAGIAASAGSSCASGAQEPSHVLKAMGVDPAIARGSIRFSFGPGNSMEDVKALLDVLPPAVARLRAMGS